MALVKVGVPINQFFNRIKKSTQDEHQKETLIKFSTRFFIFLDLYEPSNCTGNE